MFKCFHIRPLLYKSNNGALFSFWMLSKDLSLVESNQDSDGSRNYWKCSSKFSHFCKYNLVDVIWQDSMYKLYGILFVQQTFSSTYLQHMRYYPRLWDEAWINWYLSSGKLKFRRKDQTCSKYHRWGKCMASVKSVM